MAGQVHVRGAKTLLSTCKAAAPSSELEYHDKPLTSSTTPFCMHTYVPPCTLRREECLIGRELSNRLQLEPKDGGMASAATVTIGASHLSDSTPNNDLFSYPKVLVVQAQPSQTSGKLDNTTATLSPFERIITSYPPILESLTHQLPTPSLLDLYHTSRHLRSFLQNYPLAWSYVSFRLPAPAVVLGNPSLGTDTPDGRERQSKPYALDALLLQVVVPCGQRIKNLDLDNTAVSGISLVSRVLEPRRGTLEHLSVRGCKNVSIKYHILPYLQLQANLPAALCGDTKLALKSLYTYRCRHHRRRPYLPTSLMRRDSDSEPTHELIELCHELGIWTDTAWCPTPGPRCLRRKDYHSQRGAQGKAVVWVPFDRLWRSGNRIGQSDDTFKQLDEGAQRHGLLWEEMETGQDGEPLGTTDGPFAGDGKGLPAHLRRSHRTFVEAIKCDGCGDDISERCEQCSIRMHCMGCRKTLCASCAFNRPIPRKTPKRRRLMIGEDGSVTPGESITTLLLSHLYANAIKGAETQDRFWWAPGAVRSPNAMNERSAEDFDSSDSENEEQAPTVAATTGNPTQPAPKLTTYWCCLEPMFSGGGGIAFLGPNSGGRGVDRIRTSPLPKGHGFEDPAFSAPIFSSRAFREAKATLLLLLGKPPDVLPYLEQESTELQTVTCPRSLCKRCYTSAMWKVPCTACKRPLCREHDFRGLKVRKCGFRDLTAEREYVRNPPVVIETPSEWEIPQFRGVRPALQEGKELDEDDRSLDAEVARYGEQSVSHDDLTATISRTTSGAFLTPQISPTPTGLDHLLSTVNLPSLSPQHLSSSRSPSVNANASCTSHLPPSFPASSPSPSRRHRSLSASAVCKPSSSRSSYPTQASQDTHFRRNWDRGAEHNQDLETEREQPQKRLPLPCSPGHPVQWSGCGAYFCLQTRPVGDARPRCDSRMRECQGCGAWVCETCQANEPSPSSTCPCTHCSAANSPFHCPVCVKLPTVRALCRREEEERAKMEREEKARRERERQESERRVADGVAEMVGVFWEAVGMGLGGQEQEVQTRALDDGMEGASSSCASTGPSVSAGAVDERALEAVYRRIVEVSLGLEPCG